MTEPHSTFREPFTPVPVRPRADGWTPARQTAFVAALERTRSVVAAARAVGASCAGAYRLRARPDAASFAAAWDRALAPPPPRGAPTTATALWTRATLGRVSPIVRAGRVVGCKVRPDNAALLTLVRRFDRACRGMGKR